MQNRDKRARKIKTKRKKAPINDASTSKAIQLYRMQQRIKHPFSLAKFIVALFLFFVITITVFIVGTIITTDSFNIIVILERLFVVLGFPDLGNIIFC